MTIIDNRIAANQKLSDKFPGHSNLIANTHNAVGVISGISVYESFIINDAELQECHDVLQNPEKHLQYNDTLKHLMYRFAEVKKMYIAEDISAMVLEFEERCEALYRMLLLQS